MYLYIIKQYDSYDYLHPDEEQWLVSMYLPKESPEPHYLKETWSEEPEIEDLYPSQLIGMYEDALERYLMPEHKEKRKRIVEWVKANAIECDALWAFYKVQSFVSEIREIQEKVFELQDFVNDYISDTHNKKSVTEIEITTLKTIQQKALFFLEKK